ncbi:MAG: S1C family serine protease [Acidobacteriota bacterium]
MEHSLAALSSELAAAVERAGRSVVAVNGRDHRSSSGIHWAPGVIVTAEHTLRRDEGITLTLPDGDGVSAALAGRDAGTDLAVLRAELPKLPVAERSDTGFKPGSIALAIGRGSETGVVASMGVVSAVAGAWRTWRGGLVDSYVRLDVTMYPGVSGGAVADAGGRLTGLATGALSRVAGVAIPLATIERVAAELLAKGRVTRGYLGVGLQPVELPEHLCNRLKLAGAGGLIVLTVEPSAPAGEAGVLIGDILVALDGKPVSDTDHVQAALGSEAVGREVKATLIRGGELAQLNIAVRERPRKGD